MQASERPIISSTGVIMAAAIIALAYTLCTQHTWEDYWITYRSSKNLATGNGLVHTPGERVHTFTSPLGVLLPAVSSLLTLNKSDDAALWIFRAMSIAAFAGAAGLMFATAKGMRLHRVAAFFLIAWLLMDNKSQDFSANGMETSFLLLFIAYSVWALFADAGSRRWLHLGLAWAGLMWTRPDSFITIAAMALGVILFCGSASNGLSRSEWLRLFFKAGLVCTAVYLPWFVTAWVYYGTPIPHTVVAKSGLAGDKTLWGALWSFIKQPVTGMLIDGPIEIAFAPSNLRFGGWPAPFMYGCRIIGVVCYLLWLVPGLRWESRVASFMFAVYVAYLDYYPAYPASWYLPGPAWLALLALAGLLEKLLKQGGEAPQQKRAFRATAVTFASAFLVFEVVMCLYSGQLFAAQQKIVDGGNRRDIGLWLREHAKPTDYVFMECLGYIGFYSELRTHDFPGLSSPAVVKASRECDHDWRGIVARLKPEWLVLRPHEATIMLQGGNVADGVRYDLVKIFDVIGKLEKLDLQGQGLLSYDSCFLVFQRVDA